MKTLILFLILIISNTSCKNPLEGSITFLTENNKTIDYESQILDFALEESSWDILTIEYDNNIYRVGYCDGDKLPSNLKVSYYTDNKECKLVSKIEGDYFIITRINEYSIRVQIDKNLSQKERIINISLINLDISKKITIIQHSNQSKL